MSNTNKVYAKFQNNDIQKNAEWNVINNYRFRKTKKINEDIINRQLETFTVFNKFKNTEGFNTVADGDAAIEKISKHSMSDEANVEISERGVNSERLHLYGWSLLTILTLTGGIIITTQK